MLAECAGDAVDRTESSDTMRNHHRADAVDSRISIRRVGGVEFVAISDPGRLAKVFELLHEFKVVIARHTENVPNASFLKAAKQKVSNRLCHNAYLLSVPDELHPIDSFRGILNPQARTNMQQCDLVLPSLAFLRF